MVKLTQTNFEKLIDSLNHRMTHIETNVKWMSRIGYYMASVLSAIAIKSLFFT